MNLKVIKIGIIVLLVIFLLPLLFLNVSGLHGWGGDFSQYIHQAINIAEGKPVAEIGYIINEDHLFLAPTAYPVGFPILLAPIYAIFGNDMTVFMFFLAILLVLLGGVNYLFLSTVNRQPSTVDVLSGFLGTLILVYNPWTIGFKSNVLSDIPFTLFFLLTTVVYLLWKKNRSPVIIGLLAGFAILIRTIGIVLIIAIALDKLIIAWSALRKGHPDKTILMEELKEGLKISTTAFVFVALLSYFVFPVPSENDYANIISSSEGFDYLTRNLRHYYKSTAAYLTVNSHSLVSEVLAWVFGGLALLGAVGRKREKLFLLLLILGVYGIAVLFPYQQGFRYVYPVVPLLIYFFFDGIKKLFRQPRWQIVFISLFFMVTLGLYIPTVLRIHSDAISPAIISGPQSAESLDAFQYIREHVPANARMVFHKPRVLSLYTDHACMGSSYKGADDLQRKFIEKKIDFILFHKWMDAPGTSLDLYVKQYNQSHLDSLWANPRYVLYKFNPEGKE